MEQVDLPADVTGEGLKGAPSVFRNRGFVALWSAQVLSQLASNMVLAALLAVVYRTTQSNTMTALLILSFLFPAVLFSAVAGVYVERADAKVILLASNLLRAGGIALFIVVGPDVGLILLINFFIATVTAFFAPAELTAIPRVVERRHLLAANSIFVLTINATFAAGFGFFGPLLLTTAGANTVFLVVASMFVLAALAIVPLPRVPPHREHLRAGEATRAMGDFVTQLREGLAFARSHRQTAWSLIYLGIATSLIGVLGAIGPGFATQILQLSSEDIFFIMGPAGLGAVIGILFLNSYGRAIPKRLLIDIGLVAMGFTGVLLALVKPASVLLHPAVAPIEQTLPDALAPIISVIAVVVVGAVIAGIEYTFVAIPAQTALQEELPHEVRGRIFGILNTLLSIGAFFPVVAAPGAADLLNLLFPEAGIPIVLGLLGLVIIGAGIASWRHNARAGLHATDGGEPAQPTPVAAILPGVGPPPARHEK
jgi:MFS family permease